MGWPWDPKPSPPQQPSTDPLRDLDPTLRAFLSTSTPSSAPSSQPPPPAPSEPDPTPVSPSSSVPPQSLYPDGRFADLWSTYRPLHEIQSEHQTDQEKLLEVLEGYKERKAEIGRIALENCVMEQSAVDECFRGGGWAKRLGMCSEEQRGFERCFLMQSRFLKALGYLSTRDRDPAIDEQIQMHADTLYHRMLTQERAVRDAESAGLPPPQFPPILSSASSSPASVSTTMTDPLSPAARKSLEDRLKDMPKEEAEVEERAVAMEAKQDENVGREIGGLWEGRASERRERKERGERTFGDWVSGLFGR